ncbi:MAG TPA: polyamine aminopropyltransferase [Candidatus Sulfotelmatobacter sp.]|nr:polyamine aminopropyltransferase [Candidatus Sulfotelmatobacter sp.]
MTWFAETLYRDVRQSFRVERVLHEGRSRFQDIKVLQTAEFGRMLVLDGICQTTERDEFIYHEMMVHVPLFAHGAARRVLIVGGGDGGILEEVLKHPVERVVLVEIDAEVIAVAREWLAAVCGQAFADPRLALIVGDGARYAAETTERFDVVIVDSSDPIGPAEVLFAGPFYGACRRCLAPGGIMVNQNGVPFLQPEELRNACRQLKPIFPHSGFYVVPVPTYYGGCMALAWAAAHDLASQSPAEIAARAARLALPLRYYNPAVHAAAFALPEYVRRLMA